MCKQKDNPCVRYRDLFEKFRQVLEAEMKLERTDARTDATLVMPVNAFRGFLDEYRKQQELRQRDKKEDRYIY